jgi:hypothetical protein
MKGSCALIILKARVKPAGDSEKRLHSRMPKALFGLKARVKPAGGQIAIKKEPTCFGVKPKQQAGYAIALTLSKA